MAGGMKGAPWFKFWVADFRGGTSEMTPHEVGVYTRLLCIQWEQLSLPNDPARLAVMAGGSVPEIVVGKFDAGDDGRLRNARLEQERKGATTRSVKAEKAAAARWEEERNAKSMLAASAGQCPSHAPSIALSIALSNAEDRGQSTEDRGEKKETENSSARAFSGHPLSAMVESLSRCQAVDGFPANRVGPMQWANVLQAFPVDDVTARAVEEFVVDCLTMGRWDDRKSPVSRLRSWIERARKSQGQPAAAHEKPRGTWDLEKQIELLRSERDRLYMSDFQNTGGPERNADRYAKWLEVSNKMRDLQAQIAGKA